MVKYALVHKNDENTEWWKKSIEYQLFHLQFSSRDFTIMAAESLIFSLYCAIDSPKQREGFCGFPELTEFIVDDHNIFVPHYFDLMPQNKAKITVLSGFIKSWEGHGRFTYGLQDCRSQEGFPSITQLLHLRELDYFISWWLKKVQGWRICILWEIIW